MALRFSLHPVPMEMNDGWEDDRLDIIWNYFHEHCHELMDVLDEDVLRVQQSMRRKGLVVPNSRDLWMYVPCRCKTCKVVCMALLCRAVLRRKADELASGDEENVTFNE